LIFNGGQSQGRLNRASVKVVFDNTKRILNVDFDEVSIERVVHRDSANEYFINGSAVRLKDILELLAGAHIGASGHHIISQGEADRILNANIKERREMIEEALGLKVYHFKREESERKLDKTEENLKQVYSLRKEIAPHIRFLEKQVEKVEKAREMRIQLEGLYKDYFKREHVYIQHEKNRIEQARVEPEKKKKELEEALNTAKQTLEQSAGKDVKSDELLSLETKLTIVRDDRDNLVRDIGRIEGQIASEERILRKQQELASSNDTKTVLLRDVESLAERLYVIVDEGVVKEDPFTLRSTLQGIRDTVKEFISRNRIQTDTSAIDESQKEIEKLKIERQITLDKLTEVKQLEDDFNAKYHALRMEMEKEKDTNREAEKMVFKIMAEQNEVHSILRILQGDHNLIGTVEGEFTRELQEGAVLVGRNVLDFQAHKVVQFDPADADAMAGAWEIPEEHMIAEVRTAQEDRRKIIERIKIRLEDAGGGSGEEILKEFEETKQRDEFLAREIMDLETSAETLRVLIKDLEDKLTLEFKAGVEKINVQFQQFFSLMFGGGTANLQVVREQKKRKSSPNPLLDLGEGTADDSDFVESPEEGQEGIDINVSLPQKKIKALMMLSGGERALASIALLFAISQVNPPPFIILDETDAALDEANSRKYGDMIDSLSKYSQLILITHNRETMSRAGILYGVTMGNEGFSKLLSIQFDEAVAVAK
ncbi:hypothetical protein H0W32_01030, partial [Patescibacteria group bacterium]|nr:hypothetical protein [Patescibacteria group bacterium]